MSHYISQEALLIYEVLSHVTFAKWGMQSEAEDAAAVFVLLCGSVSN